MAGYYIAADIGCILAGFVVKRLAGAAAGAVHRRGCWCSPAGRPDRAGRDRAVARAGTRGCWSPVLMLVGAGILGLHPVYYALAQELPAKRMGSLSGVLAAVTWFTVGTFRANSATTSRQPAATTPGSSSPASRLWWVWRQCSPCGSRQRQEFNHREHREHRAETRRDRGSWSLSSSSVFSVLSVSLWLFLFDLLTCPQKRHQVGQFLWRQLLVKAGRHDRNCAGGRSPRCRRGAGGPLRSGRSPAGSRREYRSDEAVYRCRRSWRHYRLIAADESWAGEEDRFE